MTWTVLERLRVIELNTSGGSAGNTSARRKRASGGGGVASTLRKALEQKMEMGYEDSGMQSDDTRNTPRTNGKRTVRTVRTLISEPGAGVISEMEAVASAARQQRRLNVPQQQQMQLQKQQRGGPTMGNGGERIRAGVRGEWMSRMPQGSSGVNSLRGIEMSDRASEVKVFDIRPEWGVPAHEDLVRLSQDKREKIRRDGLDLPYSNRNTPLAGIRAGLSPSTLDPRPGPSLRLGARATGRAATLPPRRRLDAASANNTSGGTGPSGSGRPAAPSPT
eukprot:1882799-Rhodomonas_salina.1